MEFSLFQGLVDNHLLPHRPQPFGSVIAECRVGRKAVLDLSLYYLFQVDGFLIRNELAFFLFYVFALTRDLDFVTQHCWDLAGICKCKSCVKRSFSQ